MEKAKSQNKKLIYAVVGLAFALFAVLGALIGVFAATSQSITTGFNINYTVGDNVAAAIRTEAYVPNSGNAASTIVTDKEGNEVDNENGYVVFNAPDESVPASVYIGDFSLTPTTPQLEFYFTIENLLEEGYVQAVVGKNCTTQNNMTVKTYYYNTDSFTSTDSATTIDSSLWKTNAHVPNAVAGGYKMVKVVLSVDDVNKAAACAGDLKLTLNYSSKAQDVSQLDLNKAGPASFSVVMDYLCNDPSYQSTGLDVSVAGDGSIWTYYSNGVIYIISNATISLPVDATRAFAATTGLVLNNIDTSNVENMYGMFSSTRVTSLDLSFFDTSKVKTMEFMFGICHNITSLDLTSFDTSSLTIMTDMFYECKNLTNLNLSSFDTSSVTSLSYTFSDCPKLNVLDLSNFDTSAVTSMYCMFADCEQLQTIYVGAGWTTNTLSDDAVSNGRIDVFRGCIRLVGAVEYDENYVDASMANTTTGYLTLKTA